MDVLMTGNFTLIAAVLALIGGVALAIRLNFRRGKEATEQ
jgi:hypothetical protein